MLNSEQKQQIQAVYSRWIEENNFKPRRSQREMIAAVAKLIGDIKVNGDTLRTSEDYQHMGLIEAGTGTGKTVGYLIPALVMARALEKTLVVATATINLQVQLVNKDLPDLAEVFDAEGIGFRFELAKGRGRYLCLSKVQRGLRSTDNTVVALFPDEDERLSQHEIQALSEYQDRYESFLSGDEEGWDGDRDNYPGELDDRQFAIAAADGVTCTGRRCDNFADCALFKARDRLKQSDIIIANHDLILTDAVMGGGLLPNPQDAIYVFDEAHHVPQKCKERTTLSLSLEGEQKNITRATKLLRKLKAIAVLPSDEILKIERQVQIVDEAMSNLLPALIETLALLSSMSDGDASAYRFPHGRIDADLKALLKDLANCVSTKASFWDKLDRILDDHRSLFSKKELASFESLVVQVSQLRDATKNAHGLFNDYAESGLTNAEQHEAEKSSQKLSQKQAQPSAPRARWVDRSDYDGYTLKSAPLAAGAMLSSLLWQQSFAVVLTSATLTSTRGISEFIENIGCDDTVRFNVFAGAIDYSRGKLHVPSMSAEPGNADAHTQEIIRLLPDLIPNGVGSLLLFSSWRQMEQVYETVKSTLPFEPLLQGVYSKNELIRRHKLAVDEGKTSAIFGLASFSEGVDLSGDYCQQVVIAKLPFAAPDSPLEEALSEWVESQGDNAFTRIALPQTAMRLRQACGRLLRSESDSGRISLLDRRLITKRYGQTLLSALPPYTRSFE